MARAKVRRATIGYAEYYSRPHDAVIRVYDDAGNAIERYKHKGDFALVPFVYSLNLDFETLEVYK